MLAQVSEFPPFHTTVRVPGPASEILGSWYPRALVNRVAVNMSLRMFELPLLGTCPELESLDPTVIARVISEESPPRFPQQLPRFTFPAATPKGSSFSAGSSTPVTFCDFVGLGAVVGLFGLFSAVARRFCCAFP